jgi:DNA-binding response OmpR family regulator
MVKPLRILIVAKTMPISNLLVAWLNPVPYELAVVSQFAPAKVHVDMEPDLLITELKLGDHNGLHLALRARAKSVPTIVIGDPDPVLERDASALGATYVHASDVRRDEFMKLVALLISSRKAASLRTRVAWLDDSTASFEADPHPPAATTRVFGPLGVTPLLH